MLLMTSKQKKRSSITSPFLQKVSKRLSKGTQSDNVDVLNEDQSSNVCDNKTSNTEDNYDIISPFIIRNTEPEILRKNYENIANKLIASQNQVHSLKLQLCSFKTDKDRTKCWETMFQEELNETKASYEAKMVDLTGKIHILGKEYRECENDLLKKNELIKSLEKQLESYQLSEITFEQDFDNLASGRDKIKYQMEKMTMKLSHETELRVTLEDSQKKLMDRIEELESVIENDSHHMDIIKNKCFNLENELTHHKTSIANKKSEQASLDMEHKQYIEKNFDKLKNLQSLEQERDCLSDELTQLKKSYNELAKKFEDSHAIISDQETARNELLNTNRELESSLQKSKLDSERITREYEIKLQVQQEDFDVTDRMIELREGLRKETKLKDALEKKVQSLERELKDVQGRFHDTQTRLSNQCYDKDEHIQDLETRYDSVSGELQKMIEDKEQLLKEVSQCMNALTSEKWRLDGELVQVKADLEVALEARCQAETANTALLDRVSGLERSRSEHSRLPGQLEEMARSKRELAYDVGRLQSELAAALERAQGLEEAKCQLDQGRQAWCALENKCAKTQHDLAQCRLSMQALEAQVRQRDQLGQRQERELNMANQARDEALKEAQRLMAHIDAMEDRERKRIQSLQTTVDEGVGENQKLRDSLESVVQAHTQLQSALELLQTELGHKDAALSRARQEKTDDLEKNRRLQAEMDSIYSKLSTQEQTSNQQIEKLRQSLTQITSDRDLKGERAEFNEREASRLKRRLNEVEDEMANAKRVAQEAEENRKFDLEQSQTEMKASEERLANLREQLTRERERNEKRIDTDNSELRKQCEKLTAENGELIRSSAQLRTRCSDLEDQIKDLKDLQKQIAEDNLSRIKSNASSEESSQAVNSNIEMMLRSELEDAVFRMKRSGDEIAKLETEKDIYTKKIREQESTITAFMQQVEHLQYQMKQLRDLPSRDSFGMPSLNCPTRDTNTKATGQLSSERSDKTVVDSGLSGSDSNRSDSLAEKAQQAILSTRHTMSRLTQYISAQELKTGRSSAASSQVGGNNSNNVFPNYSSDCDPCQVGDGTLQKLSDGVPDPRIEGYRVERDFSRHLEEQLKELKLMQEVADTKE